MASTFTNAKLTPGTSRGLFYTAPAGTQSVVHGFFFSNVDTAAKNTHKITVEIYDGTTYWPVAKEITVAYGNSLIFDKAVNLKANESLYLTADAAASVTAMASILEKV